MKINYKGEMMNSRFILFVVYMILWAIAAFVSTLLEKSAKDFQVKKKIRMGGMIVIFILMFAFGLLARMPIVPLSIFMLFGFTFAFIMTNNIPFCSKCNDLINNSPFSKIEYCPKCGGKLIKEQLKVS